MTPEAARDVALRLIHFLETGEVPPGLFTDDVFCDFTLPCWRLQAQGLEPVVALRRHGLPGLAASPAGAAIPPPPVSC